MRGIYYGKKTGLPLGPYHEDEVGAQMRAKELLKCEPVDVFRVEADSPWEARMKIDAHLTTSRSSKS